MKKIIEKVKAIVGTVSAWLQKNNIKKIGNLAICLAFIFFGKHFFAAGIFFGFFLINNKDVANFWIDKAKAIFKKKEA